MKQHRETRENYLKAILRYSIEGKAVSNNELANHLDTSPASVTVMIKKLSEKGLVSYEPYKGVTLTREGRLNALTIIRKHRLWELFLVDTLGFTWDNVHEVAEQLEHVKSPELIRRIDEYLGFPKFDPHGDPIPSENGEIAQRDTFLLSEIKTGEEVVIASVKNSDPDFLQYLDKIGLSINQKITVLENLPFDESLQLQINDQNVVVSGSVSRNLFVLRPGKS